MGTPPAQTPGPGGAVTPEGPPLFSATPGKFVIMSFATVGLYVVLWFYRNWRLIRKRNRPEVIPLLRSIFAPLFAYACFGEIRRLAIQHHVALPFPISALAVAYILLNGTAYLPNAPKAFALLPLLAFLPLIPMNAAASAINRKAVADHVDDGQYSFWSMLAISVGGLMLFLALVGVFMEPDEGSSPDPEPVHHEQAPRAPMVESTKLWRDSRPV